MWKARITAKLGTERNGTERFPARRANDQKKKVASKHPGIARSRYASVRIDATCWLIPILAERLLMCVDADADAMSPIRAALWGRSRQSGPFALLHDRIPHDSQPACVPHTGSVHPRTRSTITSRQCWPRPGRPRVPASSRVQRAAGSVSADSPGPARPECRRQLGFDDVAYRRTRACGMCMHTQALSW